MNTVEEVQAEFGEKMQREATLLASHKHLGMDVDGVVRLADAYALAAHVDVCRVTNSEKALCGSDWRGMVWYCDEAKQYMKGTD